MQFVKGRCAGSRRAIRRQRQFIHTIFVPRSAWPNRRRPHTTAPTCLQHNPQGASLLSPLFNWDKTKNSKTFSDRFAILESPAVESHRAAPARPDGM